MSKDGRVLTEVQLRITKDLSNKALDDARAALMRTVALAASPTDAQPILLMGIIASVILLTKLYISLRFPEKEALRLAIEYGRVQLDLLNGADTEKATAAGMERLQSDGYPRLAKKLEGSKVIL